MKKFNEERPHRLWKSQHGTTYWRVPLVAVIGAIFTIVLLTILLWSVKQKRETHLEVEQPGELAVLLPSIAGLTQGALESGNKVELLQNGDGYFPPLLRDIAAARESIHLETYIWYDSKIASQFATALAAKAKQGVEVRILVDASGGKALKGEQQEMLERAGAKIGHFHPIRFSNLGRLNNRDHRKMVIIDGSIGYLGGHGYADTWTGNGQDKEHFRDSALRVEGPIVARLQGAFCENWVEETGEIPAGERYFKKLPPAGPTTAHLAYTSPSGGVSSVQVLYYLAIKAARREIIIQNPYMLPDRDAIRALEEAVARGVDVKIMVPSTDATDSAIVQHASHHHFGSLLKRGVKLWEYDRTLLHQKIMVIDGVWSCVGSTNFDERSFQLNDEISMGVVDPALAAQLKAAFEADLRFAKQRHLEEWKSRPLTHKALDGIAYMGQGQL